MNQNLALVTVVVRDYDEALDFYTRALNFTLVTNEELAPGKRWVVVQPPGSSAGLLLARAANARQEQAVGNQAGGRVFLFLHTDDLWRDYNAMREQGVIFCEQPREEAYGTVVVFQDLYGNRFDLIERKVGS
jgi:catechol 2,3-dioxygenase-like lactoylglutathione lyase family enzyme